MEEKREIKFRAKRKLNGDWVVGSLVKTSSEDWDFIIPTDTEYGDFEENKIRVITKTIGQHTGLKYKNGKEIFEGDCVDDKYNAIVVFKRGSFYVNHIHGKLRKDTILFEFIKSRRKAGIPCEVIGDIYSNPELLTQ